MSISTPRLTAVWIVTRSRIFSRFVFYDTQVKTALLYMQIYIEDYSHISLSMRRNHKTNNFNSVKVVGIPLFKDTTVIPTPLYMRRTIYIILCGPFFRHFYCILNSLQASHFSTEKGQLVAVPLMSVLERVNLCFFIW